MTRAEIFDKLVEILSKQLNVASSVINERSLLADELGADSLDTAEIAMIIKDEFSYDLNDEDMKKIKTVGDVVEILSARDPGRV